MGEEELCLKPSLSDQTLLHLEILLHLRGITAGTFHSLSHVL